MESNSNIFKDVPIVKISPEGIFKYIVIHACIEAQNQQKELNFIRGDIKLEYHADNFEQFTKQLKAKGFQIKGKNKDQGKFTALLGKIKIVFTCPGGGRIEHNYKGNKCFVYGYSKSYGRVDHSLAQRLISENMGYALTEIKTSQQGY